MLSYIPLATQNEYLSDINYVIFSDFEDWDEFEGYAYEISKERIERASTLLDNSEIYELVKSEMHLDNEDAVKLTYTKLIEEELKHPIRIAYLVKAIPFSGIEPVSIDNISKSHSKTEGHHRLLALKYCGYNYFPAFLSGYIDNFPINSKLPPLEYIPCNVYSIRTGFKKLTAIFRLYNKDFANKFLMPFTQRATNVDVQNDSTVEHSDIIIQFNNISQLSLFRLAQQSSCKYECFFVCKYLNNDHSTLSFGYFDSETGFETYGDSFHNSNEKYSNEVFSFDATIFDSAQSFIDHANRCAIDVSKIINLTINMTQN